MKTKLQFLTLCLTILAFSSVKTEDLVLQNTHPNTDHPTDSLRNLEDLKFSPIKIQKFYYDTYYGLFAQFGAENPYSPLLLNMRSGVHWMNNIAYFARNYNYYKCSESKTCKTVASGFTLEENDIKIKGDLVTELMTTAGFTASASVLVGNEMSIADKKAYPGWYGLGYRTKNDPSFSLYIDNHEGELLLGGFNQSKVANAFQKVPLLIEEGSSDLTIAVKRISLSGQTLDNLKAVIDIGTPFVVVPPAIMTKVKDEIEKKKLHAVKVAVGPFGDSSINCKAITSLEDLVLDLDGTSVRIPPSSYITLHRGFKADASDSGCFLSLVPWDEAGSEKEKKIILGQPFLKTYYSYFEPQAKQVSFSKVGTASLTYVEPPSSSPWIGFVFLLLIVGGLYWFMKKYGKPGSGVASLFNQGTRLGGGGANPNAGRDRWRHQELNDSLGDNETNP